MKKYTDKMLAAIDKTIERVMQENDRQLLKWGVQTRSSFEWMTYITEEVGELAQAVSEFEYREGKKEDVRKEAIHVASLALKIAEMFDDEED